MELILQIIVFMVWAQVVLCPVSKTVTGKGWDSAIYLAVVVSVIVIIFHIIYFKSGIF